MKPVWLPVYLSLLLAAGAGRAAPPTVPDPPGVIAAKDAAEELDLTRIFARIQLSPSQAAQLAPVLEQAQTRLQAVDDAEATALARLKGTAEQARDQAAVGRQTSPAVEQQHDAALRTASTRREKTRSEQVVRIRSALGGLLNQPQLAALREEAQTAWEQDPGAGDVLTQADAVDAQGNPVPGRGAGAWISRMMDRFRGMPEDRFASLQDRFMARTERTGDEGPPPRLAAMMELAYKVRAMAPEEYAHAKPVLSSQLQSTLAGSWSPDPDLLLDAFIERHLLQPAAPRAARRRAGQR